MKNRVTYILFGISATVFLIWLMRPEPKREDFSEVVKIALRDVGNKLLLTENDSTSVIKPVKEVAFNKYEVEFNSDLSFKPNDLVEITKASLQKSNLPENYRVEVLQCNDQEVAYSYEISTDSEKTIVPCMGRELPRNCYQIAIKFTDISQGFSKRYGLLLLSAGILFLALISKMLFRSKSGLENGSESMANYPIGIFKFYPEQNKLVKAATEISLSNKECELLEIFVANKNQIVKRDELTKKVWEDNGVIVGRSLDTYISKLRKKLKEDESIKLTNVHGVGYKLEIV